MTLRETQAFVTRMMRDDAFRTLVFGPELDLLADQFGLDQEDRAQIRAIDPTEFDTFAGYARRQRVERREAEYGLFLDHLSRFRDTGQFFQEYHQAVTIGQGERREELRRFDNFAFEYIIEQGLPEYLVDLVRFCSAVCELGETPKVRPGEPTGSVRSDQVGGNYLISLKQPFAVMTFRHDVLRLADETDDYGVDPAPRQSELLLQRDWSQHKRTLAFPLRDHPLLARIAQGPLSVFELAAALPEFSNAFVLRTVRERHADGLLHATPPSEIHAGTTRQGPAVLS